MNNCPWICRRNDVPGQSTAPEIRGTSRQIQRITVYESRTKGRAGHLRWDGWMAGAYAWMKGGNRLRGPDAGAQTQALCGVCQNRKLPVGFQGGGKRSRCEYSRAPSFLTRPVLRGTSQPEPDLPGEGHPWHSARLAGQTRTLVTALENTRPHTSPHHQTPLGHVVPSTLKGRKHRRRGRALSAADTDG